MSKISFPFGKRTIQLDMDPDSIARLVRNVAQEEAVSLGGYVFVWEEVEGEEFFCAVHPIHRSEDHLYLEGSIRDGQPHNTKIIRMNPDRWEKIRELLNNG